MQTQTYKKAPFKGDKEGSTYRWELHLTNGYILDGYSKNIGQAEKQDKEALFQDCIARLLNNGYLDKCYQMHFFRREFLHRSKDSLLLEMYPVHYVAHGEINFQLPTTEFLSRIYEARKTGTGLDYKTFLPSRPGFRHTEKTDFEFTKTRFPTIEHLVNHCKDLLAKYPRSRVEGYYHTCKHYYSGQTLPQVSPTVRPASVTTPPPTPELGPASKAPAAQPPSERGSADYVTKSETQTRQAIANLNTRFKAN